MEVTAASLRSIPGERSTREWRLLGFRSRARLMGVKLTIW
jgi:hypothetical protein